MPYNPQYDLRGQRIEDTFQQVLQYNTSSNLAYDGLGNQTAINALSASFSQTASFALNASTGSNVSSSYALTASFALNGGGSGTTLTTASTYQITSSRAVSASYSQTASFALNGAGSGTTLITASTYQITSSWTNNTISSSYATTSSFALNSNGNGTTLTTASTYQITASNSITASFLNGSISNAVTSQTASYVNGSSTLLRLAESNLGIKYASPVGGNSGDADILLATSSYEGQLGIAYYGNKAPSIYFSSVNGGTGTTWTNGYFNFPSGIGEIGAPGPAANTSNVSNLTINVNGSSAGNSSGADSGLNIANYSTSSTNSGTQVILNIIDASGSLNSTNGCAWAHVPSNRKLSLIPGWNYMIYNTDATNMRGFAVAGAGIGPSDGVSGNYSLMQCDLVNKLFRIPLWYSGSYQPSDFHWQDAFTVNPSNGNIVHFGTSSFAQTVFITGSLNAPIITGSLFGTSSVSKTSVSSSYTVTASFALNGGGSGTTLITASTYQITSSNTISSSYSQTASFALNGAGSGTTLITASTYQITSSYAVTASFLNGSITSAITSQTASYLSGFNFVNTSSIPTTVTQSWFVVSQQSTGSFTSVFYNYTINSGSNARAGQLFACWNSSSIQYTDVSTQDIGNTSQVTMSLGLSASIIQVSASIASTKNWNIKTIGTFL